MTAQYEPLSKEWYRESNLWRVLPQEPRCFHSHIEDTTIFFEPGRSHAFIRIDDQEVFSLEDLR